LDMDRDRGKGKRAPGRGENGRAGPAYLGAAGSRGM